MTVGDTGWFQREGHVPRVIETRAGPLQVAFVPWPQVSQLLANSEEAENASIEQLYKLIERAISDLVIAQAEHIDPDIPAILTCHLPLSDKLVAENSGSEMWMQSGTVPRVPLSALHMDRFDYVALGHHHNVMQLNANPPCWYSGALREVDFGDARTAKGFMTLEFDTAKPRGERLSGSGAPRHVEVKGRPFVSIPIKPRAADPNEEVLAAIGKHDVTNAIVKVEVHVDRDQEALLRLSEARKALAAAHVIAGIRTVLPEDSRSALPPNIQPDASSPIETLDTYLKLRDVPDERRARLLAAATEIIEESEAVGV